MVAIDRAQEEQRPNPLVEVLAGAAEAVQLGRPPRGAGVGRRRSVERVAHALVFARGRQHRSCIVAF